jgi:Rrf2 family protein
MFTLTRKTDYAIIALSHMARDPEGVFTAREIAERYQMPPSLLMNVLKTMCQGELVRSIRGAKGGYTLAMPAARLTLADIIAVVEGPIRFVQCTGQHAATDEDCDLLSVCPVKRPAQRIHEKLSIFLEQITLADIVDDTKGREQIVGLSVGGTAMDNAAVLTKCGTTKTEA